MTIAMKPLSAVLILVLLVTPVAASAQTQTVPAAPAPAGPHQDLYQEALRTAPPEERPDQEAYDTGATFVNIFLAPGMGLLCGMGTVASAVLLFVSFGTGYPYAKRLFEEGCGGPYLVTGDDLRRENERRSIPVDRYLK